MNKPWSSPLLGWPHERFLVASFARDRHHPIVIVLERPDPHHPYFNRTMPCRSCEFCGCLPRYFSEPPYNERFFPSEEVILHRYLQTPENICLFAVKGRAGGWLWGGRSGQLKPDIARDLCGLLPVPHTLFAELGVLESARHAGIGKTLVAQRLELVDHQVYPCCASRERSSEPNL